MTLYNTQAAPVASIHRQDTGKAWDRPIIVEAAAIIGVLVLAILVRTVSVDSQALWSDEGQTLSLSLFSIGEMFWQATDPTPFLYYAIHQAFLSPSSSVVEIRAIAVVFGVLSVGLMYVLGRLALGRPGGLLCAALLAVWTSHVDYSMEARAYSLLGFTTMISFIGVVVYGHAERARIASGHRWTGLALLAVGNVLGFYTHVTAVFPIAATSIIVFLMAATQGLRHWRSLFATYVIMAALAVPGVLRLLLQARTGDDFNWLVQAGPTTFVSTFADIFYPIGLWDNVLTNHLDIRIPAKYVAIPLISLGVAVLLFLTRKRLVAFAKAQPHTAALVIFCLLSPFIIWLAGYVIRPIFLGRVLLFAIPGFILLLAGMITLQNGRQRVALSSLVLVAVWLASTLLFGMMREKEDWRGAAAYLSSNVGTGDVVVVCADFNYPAARHAMQGTAGRLALAVNERDDLILLEQGLGADKDWAGSYFRAVQRDVPLAPSAVEFKPGQSIWRIDAACPPDSRYSRTLDRLLKPIDAAPVSLWQQKAKYYDHLEIRRYRVDAAVTLTVTNGYSPQD